MKNIWIFLCSALLVTTSLSCQNWSLQDANAGWNSRELVTLYFHNSEPQTQWAWQALSKYRFQGSERVLDFGSGDGKLSALMSFMVPQGSVTGVDISKEMTLYASQMFPKYAYSNLFFTQSGDVDFANATFPEKFDLVTSFCVFHLVPHSRTVIKEIKAKMKAGACFVATLPIQAARAFYQAASEEMTMRGWSFPAATEESVQMRNPEKIREILVEAGFRVLSLDVVPIRNAFASKEELIDWLEGTLTANWNIPKQDRRQFFTDTANRYLEYMPEDIGNDGVVYFTITRVDFVAEAVN